MNIVERRKPLKGTNINVTNHAYERYLLRVNKYGNRDQARTWLASALNKAKFVKKQEDLNEVYVYGKHKLIIDKHLNIVTILSTDDIDWDSIEDTRDDITKYVTNKLKREVRPLVKRRKELQVSIYEAEINKIRARSPKIKANIQEKIDTLINDKNKTTNKMEGIVKTAKKYYIDPVTVHKELANI